MKSCWINRDGGTECVIFFHGWGMSPDTLTHLIPGKFAILVCYDYRELAPTPELDAAFSAFAAPRLVAWSLGVWAAAAVCGARKFAETAALNGTLAPVSADCGIAPEVFDGTGENWHDEAARRAFYRRSGGATPQGREPEEQREELLCIRRFLTERSVHNIYNRAIISGRDRIFPAAAQQKFWGKSGVEFTLLPGRCHDLAASLNSWEEVVALG